MYDAAQAVRTMTRLFSLLQVISAQGGGRHRGPWNGGLHLQPLRPPPPPGPWAEPATGRSLPFPQLPPTPTALVTDSNRSEPFCHFTATASTTAPTPPALPAPPPSASRIDAPGATGAGGDKAHADSPGTPPGTTFSLASLLAISVDISSCFETFSSTFFAVSASCFAAFSFALVCARAPPPEVRRTVAAGRVAVIPAAGVGVGGGDRRVRVGSPVLP